MPFRFTARVCHGRLIDSSTRRSAVVPDFRNEPPTDFSVDANANAFKAALAKVQKRLPLQGQNRIGGRTVSAAKHFTSVNPCDFKQVIGRFPEGTAADAAKAIAAATKTFPAWSA